MSITGGVVREGVEGLVSGVGGILDDLFTSDEERGKVRIALEKIKNAPFLAALKVLEHEAQHKSIFVSGARPSLLWACVLSIAYEGFIRGILTWIVQTIAVFVPEATQIPELPSLRDVMWEIVTLAMALYGVRGVERVKGIATRSLTNAAGKND